ncbi:NifU family protein [Candidatus Latescibacterota bacterium]
MEEKIKAVLEEIRPSLQADGGDVEYVSLDGDIVKVRLKGACSGCPMATMTLKNGIENLIKQKVPGVASVESV